MKTNFDNIDTFLIWLYLFIDDLFQQTELPLYTMRLSNNQEPYFTDVELFTCAIFTEIVGCNNKKHGHRYLKQHYFAWFPKLPSYEVYNRKLDKYHEALTYMFKMLRNRLTMPQPVIAQIDTAPIVVCQQQHIAKANAARPVVAVGYCASKKEFYRGVKLQLITLKRDTLLPLPIDYTIEAASVHDLEIAKQTLPYSDLENSDLYGDKAYIDADFQLELFETKGINLITPTKKQKGQPEFTLFQKAYNAIHSSIRQPIDTLFGWINDQTHIENASKVRSINGLFYHINVKMVAALLLLMFSFN
jgi:hypothetical protein